VNWAFEPERAALLIHDMQEYFLNFWGENSAMMEKVVANIAACATSANSTIFRFTTPLSRKSRAMKTAPC
jgi:isochorismate hydrolase